MIRLRKRLRKALFALCMALLLTGFVVPSEAEASASLTGTKLKNTSYTFTVGAKKKKIKFKSLPTGAEKTFKSSNKKVAKVTKYGYIYPKGEGSCTITCTLKYKDNTKKLKVYVTVKPSKKETVTAGNGKYNLKDLWEEGKDDGLDIVEINADYGDIIEVKKFGSVFGFFGNLDDVYVNYTLEELGEWDNARISDYLLGIMTAGYTPISIDSSFGDTTVFDTFFKQMMYTTEENDVQYSNSTDYYELRQPGVYYMFYPASGGHYQKITVSAKTSDGVPYADYKLSDTNRIVSWQENPMYLSSETKVYKYSNSNKFTSGSSLPKGTKVFLQGTYKGYTRIYWGGDYAFKCKYTGWIPATDATAYKYETGVSTAMINKWLDNWGNIPASDIKSLGWGDDKGFNKSVTIMFGNDPGIIIKLPKEGNYRFSTDCLALYYKGSSKAKIYDSFSYITANYAIIRYNGYSASDKCKYSIIYVSDTSMAGK